MRLLIVSFIVYSLVLSGCEHNRASFSKSIRASPHVIVRWDSLFAPGGKLTLNQGSHVQPGYTGLSAFLYRDVVIIGGHYFLVSDNRKSIVEYDSAGNFVRRIGSEGVGPGELNIIASVTAGKNNSILAVNMMPPKVVFFYGKDYSEFQDVRLPTVTLQVAQMSSGYIIGFSLYSESLLNIISLDGKMTKGILEPCDKSLKLFEATTFIGALWNGDSGDIYLADPTCNRIVRIGQTGKVLCEFISGGEVSDFAPQIVRFPRELSPYERGNKQMDYFEKFYHPVAGGMMSSATFAVEYVKVRDPRNISIPSNVYVTLFDTSGAVVAGGLQPPHRGICIFPAMGRILEVVQPSVSENGKLTEPVIYQYSYKLNSADWTK